MDGEAHPISAFRLGTVPYEEACRLQERIAAARAEGAVGDTLLLLEHPAVITVGRGGGEEDVLASASRLRQAGVRVVPTDRGGRATYHGPGQMVVYPILKLAGGDLYAYVRHLEEVVIRVLEGYGLPGTRLDAHPGVWLDGSKIAAVGLAVHNGVTRHGLALNVAPDMAHFDLLIPCGITDRGVTSMERELELVPRGEGVADRFIRAFAAVFGRPVRRGDPAALAALAGETLEHPSWLWQRVSPEAEAAVGRMEHLLGELHLHTVCQEARCPNLPECFGRGTATFMILGETCTRGCRFCAVNHGRPAPPDPHEPERVAEAAARLGLEHVVVTSVTRDDLPDGGAGQFAVTIDALHRRLPGATVEVLIPDFAGSRAALDWVLAAEPEVLNHNLETVPRLYPQVRPGADYRRSLGLLAYAKAHNDRLGRPSHGATKSGLMLGLGERAAEVFHVLRDLRRAGCDMLTLGQYLQPTGWDVPAERQLPVFRYVAPDEFRGYEEWARGSGFQGVVAGPVVRSSYRAGALCKKFVRTPMVSRSNVHP
ncbi:MAG: lipoyl synthase [Chloroflexota bacterium]|nr:lipoyl synthase [Chloroflexota bacterium]